MCQVARLKQYSVYPSSSFLVISSCWGIYGSQKILPYQSGPRRRHLRCVPVDKQKALRIVEDYIELIKEALEKEGRVMLSGFGSYEVKLQTSAQGQKSTDRGLDHPAGAKVVKFKPSQLLRKAMNGRQVTAKDEAEEDGDDSAC